jgi:hypothetical protein
VPEEPSGAGSQTERPEERFERRLNRLEEEILKENRWWRGGLIAALVFVAIAILVAGHHHHRRDRMAMGQMPMVGAAMPYRGYGPYPPPPGGGFGWRGPWGFADGHGGCRGPWSGQPGRWSGPGSSAPQGQSPQEQSPPNR